MIDFEKLKEEQLKLAKKPEAGWLSQKSAPNRFMSARGTR